MDDKGGKKRARGRRSSDQMLQYLAEDLGTIARRLNYELGEVGRDLILLSKTDPFVGRRKEDRKVQSNIVERLKEIEASLVQVLDKIPDK
jgi:hypothetical protein